MSDKNSQVYRDQLDDNVIEMLSEDIGNNYSLRTENQRTIVAALNEINGKDIISKSVGNPLLSTDTFADMGEKIDDLTADFKAKLLGLGVGVSTTDKFRSLINKLNDIVTGGGGSGIQFATGTVNAVSSDTGQPLVCTVTEGLSFKPSFLFIYNSTTVRIVYNEYKSDTGYEYYYGGSNNNIDVEFVAFDDTTYVREDGFSLKADLASYYGTNTRCTWLAYGAGEANEDGNDVLFETLKEVLEDEGVEVTEEDNMASLIIKVDEEFDRKNANMLSNKQGLVDVLTNKGINVNINITWEELNTIVNAACNSVMTDVTSLHCGGNQTVIIKNDGTVWGTGANTMGQLGFGNTTNIEYFKQMSITDIKQLEHGYGSIMIIKNDGTVWACGNNSNGQLGLGLDITSSSVPPVTTFGQLTGTATVISLGNIHSMIVHNGELYYAGNGSMGQFGTGGQHGSYNTFQKNTVVSNVEKVFCGIQNTIIIKSDGTIMGCGNNVNYELGLTGQQILNFTTIDTDVIDVVMNCNTNNTMYIKADNTLWGMGKNNNGILGLGNTTIQQTKVKLADNVRLAALGANHSIIVKYDGTVWVSGSNTYGQLGLGDNTQRNKFTQLTGIDGNLIKQVGCNQTTTHILLNTGILLNCGQNNYGQLGKDCRKFIGV